VTDTDTDTAADMTAVELAQDTVDFKTDLRDLLDEWREKYDQLKDGGFTAEYVTLGNCIEDLEEVFDGAE